MRRFVRLLAVALCIAPLAACAGGGTVLSTDATVAPDRVIVTVVGPSNIARVLPGGFLTISAVSVKGSSNGLVTNNRYRWAAVVTAGGTYVADAFGTTKPCGSVMKTTAGVTTTFTPDFGINIAIDPTNEANIEFLPPPIFPPPAAGSTISIIYPYCVTVTAQVILGPETGGATTLGASGSLNVVVVDPQNPTQ